MKYKINAVNFEVLLKKTKQSRAHDHKRMPSWFAHLRLLKSQINFLTYCIFWECMGNISSPIQITDNYMLLVANTDKMTHNVTFFHFKNKQVPNP